MMYSYTIAVEAKRTLLKQMAWTTWSGYQLILHFM